jgi:hypothetical protein
MGHATDAQLCYGIAFDSETEFPWSEADGIDEWWITVQGFKPTVEIYDEDDNWINGVQPDRDTVVNYYNERHEFIKTMRELPVHPVTHCSCEYPMTILAVKGTFVSASRGNPKLINVSKLHVSPEDQAELLEFCREYGIKYSLGPCWWLSSLECY